MQVPRMGLLAVLLALTLPTRAQSPSAYPVHFTLPGRLLSQEPSAVVEPLSLAALFATGQALASLNAGSWTLTRYRLQGIDVTDPYQPGRLLAPVEVLVLERVAIEPDGVVALSLREPGTSWHGQIASYNTASRLASDNLPPPAERGALLRPDQFHWWTRNYLEAGGPLGRRADLFASAAGQWASETVPDQPTGEELNSRWLFLHTSTRVRPNARNQLDTGLTTSRLNTSGWALPAALEALAGRRMAPPLQPHRDLAGDDRLTSVQAGWSRAASGAIEIRWGYSQAHLSSEARGSPTPTYIELTTGAVSGPPPLASRALRSRHSLQGAFEPAPLRLFSRDHRPKLAVEYQSAGLRNRYTAPGGVHAVTAEGVPEVVVEPNTPAESRARIQSFSLLAEDRVALSGWLSTEAGLLTDVARSGATAAIRWRHLAPRLGLTVALGPLTLRGRYARSYAPLAGRYLDFAGPDGLGGLEYRWTDSNGDRVFQPQEKRELLRRFGSPYSSISPALRRPYVDEFTVSAEGSLPARSFARIRLFRRDDKDRLAAMNTGVPPESFRPRTILDPGPDYLPGTFDDQKLVAWGQDPATFGADHFLLSNPGLRTLTAGLLAEAGTEHDAFQCRLSLLAAKSVGPANPGNNVWENDPGVVGSLYQDPNTLVNASGRSFFDRAYVGKFLASWRAPRRLGGFEAGSVVTYLDGLAFGRRLLVKGLAQGPLLVSATVRGSQGGGHRTQYYLSWDLRLSRRIGPLLVHADGFNVLNRASRLREDDLSGPFFSRRLPLAIQPARFLRLGVAYSF